MSMLHSPGFSLRFFCLHFCAVALVTLWAAAVSVAQPVGTGTIMGRVFNPVTQEYVRNAEIQIEGANRATYSVEDGSYVLANVPAGQRTLIVTYTGYNRETATVAVSAGQTATRDFELKGATFQPGAKPGDAIVLGEFVVSTEREGNAKAIMEQRAAINMKSVVASDNFGDVTGGNVGEFIKYLPGVVMDYVDSDARTARIGGLSPVYTGVSVDGMSMASAPSASFGGASRQFEFEQASINGIESIEINKTTTASPTPCSSIETMKARPTGRSSLRVKVELAASQPLDTIPGLGVIVRRIRRAETRIGLTPRR